MANYSELLADINAAIYENNDQEIDALDLRAILRQMVTSLGSGYIFKGIATPSSPTGTGTYEPDQNVFYLATTAGTYTYLGGLSVSAGEVAFLTYDGTWTKISSDLLSKGSIADNLTTNDATKPLSAKQGKVLKDALDGTDAELAALGHEVSDNTQDIADIRQAVNDIQPIVIEGDVTNAPDEEDITTDENDLLKFANRSTLNGMGYKILRRNKTFAEQVTDVNTIYEIRYDFALAADFTMPADCVLYFNGGSIAGGYEFLFNNTTILGKPSFNCIPLGTINMSVIRDEYFLSSNDTLAFKFLVKNTARNNGELVLSRDYEIDFSDASYRDSTYHLIDIADNSGFTIHGNGRTITDIYTSLASSFALIFLSSCDNFKLYDLNYTSSFDAYAVEQASGRGIYVVGTAGDCAGFEIIGLHIWGCNTSVRAGAFGYENYVHKGLNNSRFVIIAEHVGYGIVFEVGESNDVDLKFEYAHRGVYACGLQYSKVRCIGKECTAPTVCNVGVSVKYDESDENYNSPIFVASHDLDFYIEGTGTSKSGEPLLNISFNYENHFADRVSPVHFDNIDAVLVNRNSASLPGRVIGLNIGGVTNPNVHDTFSVRIHDSELLDMLDLCRVTTDAFVSLAFENIKHNGGQAELGGCAYGVNNFLFKNCQLGGIAKQSGANLPIRVIVDDAVIAETLSAPVDTNDYVNYITFYNHCSFGQAISGRKFRTISNGNGVKIIASLTELVGVKSGTYYMEINDSTQTADLKMPSQLNLMCDGAMYELYIHNKKTSNQYLDFSLSSTASYQRVYQSTSGSLFVAPKSVLKIIFMIINNIVTLFVEQPNLTINGGYGADSVFPDPTDSPVGVGKFNVTQNKMCYWNGTYWADVNGNYFKLKYSGTTAERNTMTTDFATYLKSGFCYFDETLGKPVWRSGSGWVDATGASV